MELLQTRRVPCPCCGESMEIVIDCSISSQEYVEDCQVCCEPMLLTVAVGDDPRDIYISVRRENA
jgi:hypothetical protein